MQHTTQYVTEHGDAIRTSDMGRDVGTFIASDLSWTATVSFLSAKQEQQSILDLIDSGLETLALWPYCGILCPSSHSITTAT